MKDIYIYLLGICERNLQNTDFPIVRNNSSIGSTYISIFYTVRKQQSTIFQVLFVRTEEIWARINTLTMLCKLFRFVNVSSSKEL